MLLELVLTVAFLGVVEPQETPSPISVCEVADQSHLLSGKKIHVRGIIQFEYHGTFIVGRDCGESILIRYPQSNSRERAHLERDATYTEFRKLLTQFKPGTMDLSNRIEATLHGRFASAYRIVKGKKVRSDDGFGSQKAYMMQLVLEKVSELKAAPLDSGGD
jgi:hypothetical protein